MASMYFQHPQAAAWQARLTRVPRWGWITLIMGVVLPLLVLGIALLVVSVVTGVLVMGAVIAIGSLMGMVHRWIHRGRALDDGRRNVKIIVHSARVIDS